MTSYPHYVAARRGKEALNQIASKYSIYITTYITNYIFP